MNTYQMMNPEAFTEEYEEEQRLSAILTLENAKERLEKTLSYFQGYDWNNPTAQAICKELDTIEAALAELKAEPDNEFDESMDGDHESALASCGWGTDEDYGYFGGDE